MLNYRWITCRLAILGSCYLPTGALQAQSRSVSITTLSAWDGGSAVAGLAGLRGTRSLGQHFLAPGVGNSTVFERFSLYLSAPYTGALQYRPLVMAWSTAHSRPVGPVLWSGAVASGPPDGPEGAAWPFTRVDFAIGAGEGVRLRAGDAYVFVLSTVGLDDQPSRSSALLGFINRDAYSSDAFVSNRDDFNDPPPYSG